MNCFNKINFRLFNKGIGRFCDQDDIAIKVQYKVFHCDWKKMGLSEFTIFITTKAQILPGCS